MARIYTKQKTMPEDPVTAVAAALTEAVAAAAQIQSQLNSSSEIQAAIAAEVQKLKDSINKALEQNDLATIRDLCA